ncbi:MAG: rod shape-determining protein RodA [Tenuifilaceae bacterium]
MQRRSNTLGGLDWTTVLIYLMLVFMGWFNIYAAIYSEEHNNILDFSQRYGMQLIWILFAFALALVVMLIDSRFYFVFANFFFAISILLLIAALVFGKEINGAKSWIQIGSFGLQPAEFAKFATALALAKMMSVYNFKILQIRSILKIGTILIIPVLIIFLQNDTGSALVFSAFMIVLYREGVPNWFMFFLVFMVALFIFVLMFSNIAILIMLFLITMILFFFISRKQRETLIFTFGTSALGVILFLLAKFLGYNISPIYFFLIPILVVIPIALIYGFLHRLGYIYILTAFLFITTSFTLSVDYGFHKILSLHQQKRINDLLGIEADPLGWGYNVNQSKIAIGSGGFWGKGFLGGTQTKFNFVPEQSTDFIFCTVGEEWGFVGSFLVVILFMALLLRLIVLAERQREAFSRIYGYCVVAVLFFHISVNIGMTIGLFPVIGIPLPFFSYGGSSLWAFTILLFIFIKLDSTRLG